MINLDKIKLISKEFNEFLALYTNSCQLLENKLNIQIEVIENITPSHDFEKCSKEIGKIAEALPLGKHLSDDTLVKQKYDNIKRFLINYLRKSTGNFLKNNVPIISSEKNYLDEINVNKLNEWTAIIESARSTYSLESHISLESIKKLYDSFLMTIKSYNDDINKQIIQLLEKKEEDTKKFAKDLMNDLHNLMKELGMVRRISNVDLKTIVSYYSILEKICGMIYEMKREAQIMLIGIMEKENVGL